MWYQKALQIQNSCIVSGRACPALEQEQQKKYNMQVAPMFPHNFLLRKKSPTEERTEQEVAEYCTWFGNYYCQKLHKRLKI